MKIKKSILALLICGVLSVTTTACGNSNSKAADKKTEQKTEQTTEQKKEAKKDNSPSFENPDVKNVELGKISVMLRKKLNLEQTQGPFTIKIKSANLGTVEPNEDYKSFFDNKEKCTLLTLVIEVEHNNDNNETIYPAQGKIVTNTKEQIDAELFMSDQVGGDFLGKVVKDGSVIFILKSNPKDLTNIKYNIEGSFDSESLEQLGEDFNFDIDLTK